MLAILEKISFWYQQFRKISNFDNFCKSILSFTCRFKTNVRNSLLDSEKRNWRKKGDTFASRMFCFCTSKIKFHLWCWTISKNIVLLQNILWGSHSPMQKILHTTWVRQLSKYNGLHVPLPQMSVQGENAFPPPWTGRGNDFGHLFQNGNCFLEV